MTPDSLTSIKLTVAQVPRGRLRCMTRLAWNNIVDVLVFLTNMKKDFAQFNTLYAVYFAGDGKPNPTRTTIEVGSLPTPIAVELKVIATIGS